MAGGCISVGYRSFVFFLFVHYLVWNVYKLDADIIIPSAYFVIAEGTILYWDVVLFVEFLVVVLVVECVYRAFSFRHILKGFTPWVV